MTIERTAARPGRALAPDELVVLPGRVPPWVGGIRLGADVLGLAAGLLISLGLRGRILEPLSGPTSVVTHGLGLAVLIPVWLAIHLLALNHAGLYRKRVTRSAVDDLPRMGRGVTYGALVDLATTYVLRVATPRGLIMAAWAVAMVAIASGRALAYAWERRYFRTSDDGERAIIVGGGVLAVRTLEQLERVPHDGLRLIGSVGEDRLRDDVPYLGGVDDLPAIVAAYGADQVIVAQDGSDAPGLTGAIWSTGGMRTRVSLVASHPDLILPFGEHDRLGTLPLIHVRHPQTRPVARRVRDVIDWSAALLASIVTAPLVLLLAAIVRLDSPGPAFFRQKRVGRDGKVFDVVKLRTMDADADARKESLAPLNEADGPLFKMRDDPRITRAGRWLRRTSLDELPQLWNVVRGQMSLIGPRPPTPEEVVQYPMWFRRRLAVRPGITGLWQVSGRSALPFAEAMRLDLTYVEAWSPWLDIQILLRTAAAVLRREGAY
ncbi:MAG TPA: sugar transferase [Actinomycetota bacterium]